MVFKLESDDGLAWSRWAGNRRACRRLAIGGLLVCLPWSAVWGQTDPSPFPIEKVTERFSVVMGGGGAGANVGVLQGEDGLLLIDAMTAESHEKLRLTLEILSKKPVTHVINTHGDSDHSGGNETLAQLGAVIVAQGNVTYRLPRSYPMQTFGEEWQLKAHGETIEMLAFVSHSGDDNLILLRENNVLLLGDTFTNQWHPTFYTGGLEGQLAVIDEALALSDAKTVVVPGHGRLSDREGLLAYRDQCVRWRARMAELSESGASVAEMMADSKLNELRAEFNFRHADHPIPDASFERFIQRTLSTEFVRAVPLSQPPVEAYLGDYRYEDGVELSLSLVEGRIIAKEPASDYYQLIPVARDRFHIRGSVDEGRFVSFRFGQGGAVVAAVYVTPDASHVAHRVGGDSSGEPPSP